MRRALLLTVIVASACRRSASDEPVPVPGHASPSASMTSSSPSVIEVEAPDAAGPSAADATKPLPDVHTAWCLDGWRGLDEGTCYLFPEGEATSTKRLLIYLSGIVPPVARSPQKENVQRVVASAARRARAAVLLPRGRRGIGPADAKDWWAWPTSAADYAKHAATMVAEWKAARDKLEQALGLRFERTYLAGSSSGAYFVSALALAGGFDVDGYAAASGGATGLGASRDAGIARRPFYVGYATGDPTSGGPKALGAYLTAAGWPVRVVPHPGGHGAREEYLDEAFAFWDAFERDAGR